MLWQFPGGKVVNGYWLWSLVLWYHVLITIVCYSFSECKLFSCFRFDLLAEKSENPIDCGDRGYFSGHRAAKMSKKYNNDILTYTPTYIHTYVASLTSKLLKFHEKCEMFIYLANKWMESIRMRWIQYK